jgi:transposase
VLPIEASSGVDRDGQARAPRRFVMSRRGNDLVRRYLWMAALSAIRFNPAVRALYARVVATGPYSDPPATALADAGRLVSVANPARVKAHAAAGGQGNKTDAADARAVAAFARDRNPPAWQPPAPEVRELQALVRRRDDLREMAAREKGRLDSPALTRAARKSVERAVKFLARQADRMPAEADALTAASPGLRADRDLLESIPGVGRQTASTVLAELPAVDRLPSAASAAAYAGLSPREFRSGASVRRRTRLSKAGNARLRKALFLPTQTAVRFNPLLKGFFGRLVAAGKPKMRAVGACMRKLVMLCYGGHSPRCRSRNSTNRGPAWP